jgi:hypothetical protein
MSNPPRIWLTYRPVRIGWVVEGGNVSQLATAATWSTCLWGGRFNPIIPINDGGLVNSLIKTFGSDVLIPVMGSDATKAIVANYPHLQMPFLAEKPFHDRRCEFVDIRNAVSQAVKSLGRAEDIVSSVLQPVWSQDDPLTTLFTILLGRYPDPNGVTINYPQGIRGSLEMPDKPIAQNSELPVEVITSITPLSLTSYGIACPTNRSSLSWLSPGIVLGNATDFDDLVLFWNLRAAGAEVWFYDQAQPNRLRHCADAFLASARKRLSGPQSRFNLWSRSEQWDSDLNINELNQYHCRGDDSSVWNGLNAIPIKPRFSFWNRDVVPSYSENRDGGVASFALPDQPFDFEDPSALGQRFITTVDSHQYGPASEDLTFNTPYIPELNEFYSRNFRSELDGARAEAGDLERGAVGLITRLGTQRLEIRAQHVHQWIRHFFDLFDVSVERSEPGRRCSRLIRQLEGIQGCRVLKVRGARKLIAEYGPDKSFTRTGAICSIRDLDPNTGQPRFEEFENLIMRSDQGGKLTPNEVLQYLVSRGVFRVGLNLKCPNCELESWIPLDDVKTISTCIYCGQQFDVTPQLKDRDWRYRRSGLFGRDDNQLGGIPVALALQQLDTSLNEQLLMYSTALEFKSQTTKIEKCEGDFVAVVAGRPAIDETPVQILIGEVKTSGEIDAEDTRKLGMLADVIPKKLAQAFIMFAKTGTFSEGEIALAKSLNSQGQQRVILWSRDELEPYFVYERSKAGPGGVRYASSLIDMVQATNKLFFGSKP